MACTKTELVINAGNLVQPYLNPRQQRDIRLLAWAALLVAYGGTNYYTNNAAWKNLWADTNAAMGGTTSDQAEAAQIRVLLAEGNESSSSVASLLSSVRFIEQEPELLKDQAEAFLMCALMGLIAPS